MPKYSALSPAASLSGTEIIAVDQSGVSLRTTTQGIANLLLASPTFTGVPAAPTASPGTNTTQLATTAFVAAAVTGGSGITASLVASENIAAGAIINIFSNAGVATMRNANATDQTRPAHGYVLLSVSSAATGTYYGGGSIDTALSGLTPGTTYYLNTSNGAVTATPPSTTGNIVQEVGQALSASSLAFFPKNSIGL